MMRQTKLVLCLIITVFALFYPLKSKANDMPLEMAKVYGSSLTCNIQTKRLDKLRDGMIAGIKDSFKDEIKAKRAVRLFLFVSGIEKRRQMEYLNYASCEDVVMAFNKSAKIYAPDQVIRLVFSENNPFWIKWLQMFLIAAILLLFSYVITMPLLIIWKICRRIFKEITSKITGSGYSNELSEDNG